MRNVNSRTGVDSWLVNRLKHNQRMQHTSLLDIYRLLYQKRMLIAKVAIGVFILTALISLLLPNQYKATSIFYPASDDMSRPNVIFGLATERTYFYGGNQERDRILSISQSQQLLEGVLSKIDLFTHYKIDKKKSKSVSKVEKIFRKNFKVIRNDLDALELSFIDKDPEVAAAVANCAVNVLDSLTTHMIKLSLNAFVVSLENKVGNTRKEFAALNDSILNLRNTFKLYDTKNQISQISKIITSAKADVAAERARLKMFEDMRNPMRDSIQNVKLRIAGLESKLNSIEGVDSTGENGMGIKQLVTIGPILETMEGYYYTLKAQIAQDDVLLNKLKSAAVAKTPAIHLIERANAPNDKIKPRRSFIVMAATIASVLFMILYLLAKSGLQELESVKH